MFRDELLGRAVLFVSTLCLFICFVMAGFLLTVCKYKITHHCHFCITPKGVLIYQLKLFI